MLIFYYIKYKLLFHFWDPWGTAHRESIDYIRFRSAKSFDVRDIQFQNISDIVELT